MRLVYISLGWVAGIFLAASFVSLTSALWLIGSGISLTIIVSLYKNPAALLLSVAVLAFMLGGLRMAIVPQTSDIARFNHDGGLTVEGVIIGEPDVRDDQVQFQMAVESVFHANVIQPTDGVVLVQAPRIADVKYGDYVRVTGELITPAEFDTFSYADFLARSGIFSMMRHAAVEVVSSGHGNPILSALIDLKQRVQKSITDMLPEPQAGLLAGILLGNERGISPDLADDFGAVGASHIIAISGFNMVIISGLVMRSLQRITTRDGLAVLIGLLVVGVYTVFVGANAAVIRAALMSGLLVIAPLFKRKTYVPASLAFIVLLMTLQVPTILWDVSFQLSFLAVLGLVLFVEPLSSRFDTLLYKLFPNQQARTIGSFLNEPIVVTLAAQITTLPLIILYFNRLSLVSMPVNLLIIPVQAILLIVGGLATILVFVFPPLAQILYWFDLILLSWSITIVRLFARLSFADIAFYIDPRIIALFFTLLIGGAIMYATRPPLAVRFAHVVRRNQIFTGIVAAGFAVSVLMFAMIQSRPDGYLHVWLPDVGHNNAVLIQSPGGAQMLIDGGRFPSRLLTVIGDRLPFYDREIEVLVVTHPDEFDYGALPAVLERYRVGTALLNGQPNVGEAFQELETALAPYETLIVHAGYSVTFDDGLRIEILHPQDTPDLADTINEHVIVLRLTYKDMSFLLTSDLNREGQIALFEAGHSFPSGVMQLPQHGTRNGLDEMFLEEVQPQLILLQNDRANRRGDPDADVMAMIGDVPVLRTDERGTIHLWTDGVSLWAVQDE